jgi:hypothetical protein
MTGNLPGGFVTPVWRDAFADLPAAIVDCLREVLR